MALFQRAVRLLLFVIGSVLGMVLGVAVFLGRFIIRPPRQQAWATPRHFGLPYEDVQFPARDGVRLSGWLVPAKEADDAEQAGRQRPMLILAHGWTWCRVGTAPESFLNDFPGSSPLELLPLVKAMVDAGYHVLALDLRNHGQSASSSPVSFGWYEANDILGAIDYVQSRPEVDAERVGLLGFSMGANASLLAMPRTDRVKAAVLVQPTTPTVFSRGYARFLLGPLGGLLSFVISEGYALLSRGLRLSAIDLFFAAAATGPTPVLYVQSTHDRWGRADDVASLERATPGAVAAVWVAGERFDGYQHLIDHPQVATDFFAKFLQP